MISAQTKLLTGSLNLTAPALKAMIEVTITMTKLSSSAAFCPAKSMQKKPAECSHYMESFTTICWC